MPFNFQSFNNLDEVVAHFNSEKICKDYLEQIRWAEEIKCVYQGCGHDKVYRYDNERTFKCSGCDRQFNVRTGPIFHKSKIPLTTWCAAMYLISLQQKSISITKLSEDIGVSMKTTSAMNRAIRIQFGMYVRKKIPGRKRTIRKI